jgi:preprotein translocase subunit YajC
VELLIAMAPSGAEGGGGGLVSTLIMFAAIFAIFYFMIIRPQQKRAKEREKMLSAVQKGDKVVTSGGLHGVISGLDENTVLLDVGNNVKMKFDKSAVSKVVSSKENK